MVYSSIVSFYVPFMVTLLVYVQIYIVLRRRRKRVSTKRSSHVLDSDTQAPLKVASPLHPPLPCCSCPKLPCLVHSWMLWVVLGPGCALWVLVLLRILLGSQGLFQLQVCTRSCCINPEQSLGLG